MTAALQYTKDSALALAADSDPDFNDVVNQTLATFGATVFHFRNGHEDVADTINDVTWAWDKLVEQLGYPTPTQEELQEFADYLGVPDGEWSAAEPTRSDNPEPIHERLTHNFPGLDNAIKQAVSQLLVATMTGVPHEVGVKVAEAIQTFVGNIGFPELTEEQVANADVEGAMRRVFGRALGIELDGPAQEDVA